MKTITITYIIMFFFGIYFLLLFLLLHFKNWNKLYDYPPSKRFPTITFLVPAYNEEKSIGNTIKSLLNLTYPKDKKKIIIINDGSKDKTAEIIRGFVKKYKNIKFLDKKNSGKADSLNQALKLVNTELFAVTDADSYPEKEALIKMVGFFEQDEKIAAVTSRVLVKNKNNFIEKYQDLDYNVIAWTRKLLDYVDSVYVTNGPLSIYNTKAAKKLGGFDPKNMTEDIEITWHLLSKGYQTKMSYSAKVYTTVPSRIKQWINQRVRWNLGGLQTIYKYKKYALRENIFGYFVITYVTFSFILALIGIILLARFFWLKFSNYLFLSPYLLQGYNPLLFFKIDFYFTILIIFGLSFLALSIVYYKLALRDSEKRGIFGILIYAFVYRPLYTIPLLMSIYKLIKGEFGWYTK